MRNEVIVYAITMEKNHRHLSLRKKKEQKRMEYSNNMPSSMLINSSTNKRFQPNCLYLHEQIKCVHTFANGTNYHASILRLFRSTKLAEKKLPCPMIYLSFSRVYFCFDVFFYFLYVIFAENKMKKKTIITNEIS